MGSKSATGCESASGSTMGSKSATGCESASGSQTARGSTYVSASDKNQLVEAKQLGETHMLGM